MTSRSRFAALLLAAIIAIGAARARGAVRVDQDEVIFTLRAPEAAEVYLIGDFNQWNPTVEPMNRDGDQFEVVLFLVAGEYRYQFVVDGKTINDPDNPPPAGERGSALILVERGTGLVLSTEVPGKEGTVAHARPGVRYIGALRARDDSDTAHRVDLTVAGKFEQLSARAAVATDDTSWAWSPFSVETWFDRGRVDVRAGNLHAQGFENDSTWASIDPTALIGEAGVYDYDAGFRRHGAAGTLSTRSVTLRGLYADHTTRAPAPSASLPQASVDDFVAGASADTAMYATYASFDAGDVLGFETALNFGKGKAGIVYRREAGVNPGVAASLARTGARVDATTYATRENRAVSSVWAGYDKLFGARISGAYGWGTVKSHAYGAGFDSVAAGEAIDAAGAEGEIDRTFPVMETSRGVVELGTREGLHWRALARWDFTRFDFDGLRGQSRADVHRVTIAGADTLRAWTLGIDIRYTDADYDGAPDALAIDWPELNPWLSIWDEFDVASMVGLAFDRNSEATLSLGRRWSRVAAHADATAVMRGVADELVHSSVRGHAEGNVYRDFHAGADVRAAWYDASAWKSEGALWSAYVEASYRRGPFDLSVGFGFDPVVFDPVTSEYGDIGYTEFLRGALGSGVSRSGADDLVRALIERERLLEDAAVFKVELVVDLR